MDSDTVIKVEGLSKKFTRSLKRSMLYGTLDALKASSGCKLNGTELRKSEFWALKDINFELKRGESLGIIGANGSGKSTLLRLLTGIFPPDQGSISIRGRIGALIAVGAGFHPHMSGRENIYLNGTILGMSRQELANKIDEIIAFAELPASAIDAPVRTYSSGMTVRLGFAIAIHTEPEILLIDEVLSVGDQRFRKKAQLKMNSFIRKGLTVIFISHNLHAVMGITEKTIWIKEGMIVDHGASIKVCSNYLLDSIDSNLEQELQYNSKRTGELELKEVICRFKEKSIRNRVIKARSLEDWGKTIYIDLKINATYNINETVFHSFTLYTGTGDILQTNSIEGFLSLPAGELKHFHYQLSIPRLSRGEYRMDYHIASDGGPMLEGVTNLFYIEVEFIKNVFSKRDEHVLNSEFLDLNLSNLE